MSTREPLYERDGDLYVPSLRTCSPWDSGLLHGGAIAGILAHALDHFDPNPDMRFVRITNDLFRPAPRVPVRVELDKVRDGKRISVIQARLMAEGVEVARATGLRARVQEVELPDYARVPSDTPEGPDGIDISGFLGSAPKDAKKLPPGLNFAVDAKVVGGFQFRGEGTAWLRINADVVQGQENTSISYMGMMSDFGNGLGQVYLGGKVACINADIDMHLHRYPEGEWICLQSSTSIQPTGFGTTETKLYDTHGTIGHVTQSLVTRAFSG